MLLPILNPDTDKIRELLTLSENCAVKWVKDLETGDMYYWSDDSEWITHSVMAETLHIENYTKGVLTESDL